ncbi:MAG: BlaI/MecI/CopY family transcriptional regulator [Chloroflexi bacterium]|nr:BlaI/MecI/CopY family transcriptional regulator [Chloroflexota bacterium]
MPRRWTPYDRMSRPQSNSLHKLLGELEVEVMELMWLRGEAGEATVRDITTEIRKSRPAAYTTVMTVMVHLAEKGLLRRTAIDKKTHMYHVALTKEEFLVRCSQHMVDTLVADFGDLVLAQFLEAVEQVEPKHLERLHKLLEEAKGQGVETAEREERG